MNEDEQWVTVTSSEESCDSDKIDSDIEAELYSAIHHEAATTRTSLDLSNHQSPKITVSSPAKITPNKCSFIDNQFPYSDLYTSFETSQVKATNNFSNKNFKKESNTSFNDSNNKSLGTPKVKLINDYSNRNVKRKSDVFVNSIETTQLRFDHGVGAKKTDHNTSFKKLKTEIKENARPGSGKSSFLNASIECDTSDSDSIVWSEADGCDISLQTNVAPEIVALSSDSFSEESCEPFEEVCSFNGSSPQPSTSFSANDSWHINSEDMFRSNRRGKSSRYHVRAVLQCTNCNQKGHTVKFCSVPKAVKCYVCGEDHMAHKCQKKVCCKCYQLGHDSRFCTRRFADLCFLCNMRGHPVKYCPDLWRRYHLTTTRGSIVIANPAPQDSPIYCFSCGEQGHYGAECKIVHPDRFNFRTWTSVIAHVQPSDTIKRIMEDQRHTALGGIPNWAPINAFPHNRLPPPIPLIKRPLQKKKNKKKKNNANDDLQTTKNKKKKKNRASSESQTPENVGQTSKRKEFSFPRTPKSQRRKKFGKRNKCDTEPFISGLHRRLGLSPASSISMRNNNFM